MAPINSQLTDYSNTFPGDETVSQPPIDSAVSAEVQQPPIDSAWTNPNSIPLSESTARQRTFKAKYGLRGWDMPPDQLLNELMEGREESIRQSASSFVDWQ